MNYNKIQLETGERVGSYVILERLDDSSIHVAYSAIETPLDRHVALKFLLGPYSDRPQGMQEFKDCARSLAGLNHPHIGKTFSIGHHEDWYYVATDYIRGYTLQDWLYDHRTYTCRQAKRFVLQAISALEYAAGQNVLHLNIRPVSFVMDWDNMLKVINFGLAQCRSRLAGKEVYDCLVNPYYMAPEQISGGATAEQTDMYGLGATLFHLLTGQTPFEADTNDQVCRAHLVAPFPQEQALAAGVPAEWVELFECLLQKEPAKRFATYAAFRKAVEDLPD